MSFPQPTIDPYGSNRARGRGYLWTAEESKALVDGVKRHGVGKWAKIKVRAMAASARARRSPAPGPRASLVPPRSSCGSRGPSRPPPPPPPSFFAPALTPQSQPP